MSRSEGIQVTATFLVGLTTTGVLPNREGQELKDRAQPVSALVSNPTWRVVLHGCEFDGDLEVPVSVESMLLNPTPDAVDSGCATARRRRRRMPALTAVRGAINAPH